MSIFVVISEQHQVARSIQMRHPTTKILIAFEKKSSAEDFIKKQKFKYLDKELKIVEISLEKDTEKKEFDFYG